MFQLLWHICLTMVLLIFRSDPDLLEVNRVAPDCYTITKCSSNHPFLLIKPKKYRKKDQFLAIMTMFQEHWWLHISLKIVFKAFKGSRDSLKVENLTPVFQTRYILKVFFRFFEKKFQKISKNALFLGQRRCD